ncbi:MAG: hypothetical protein FWG66_03330, partial [Spirochaetes bacterium]|nr:hypothetical protein [Spirochaetota bacterium]
GGGGKTTNAVTGRLFCVSLTFEHGLSSLLSSRDFRQTASLSLLPAPFISAESLTSLGKTVKAFFATFFAFFRSVLNPRKIRSPGRLAGADWPFSPSPGGFSLVFAPKAPGKAWLTGGFSLWQRLAKQGSVPPCETLPSPGKAIALLLPPKAPKHGSSRKEFPAGEPPPGLETAAEPLDKAKKQM